MGGASMRDRLYAGSGKCMPAAANRRVPMRSLQTSTYPTRAWHVLPVVASALSHESVAGPLL
eukprot:1123972-Pelagomonas_calceolata.AAC.1